MRKLRIAAVLLWLCLFACPACAQGVTRALLIGCDHFLSMEDTSPVGANNVALMTQTLTESGLIAPDMVTGSQGLPGVDALRQLVTEAFAGADEGDVSWFYLSTHGLWTPEQANADVTFLLSDGEKEEGVTARELRRMLDKVPGRKVVILDACHAGAAIGKGTGGSFANVFTSPLYTVICSSGAMERSWFWSSGDSGNTDQPGGGYFSGAAAMGLSSLGGYGADANRDGSITLTELKRYLRSCDGASTVQTYPQESDIVLVTCDPRAELRGTAPLQRITFEDGALTEDDPSVNLSFTAPRDTGLTYLLVSYGDDCWDFGAARRLPEEGDGIEPVAAGYHERSVSLDGLAGLEGGYVLLELITWEDTLPRLTGSRLVTMAPTEGDPELQVDTETLFLPVTGDELGITVRHSVPCELSVTVETTDGAVVKRLAASQATRPEGLQQPGSTFCWTGTLSDGTPAPQGVYRVRATAQVGDTRWEALSAAFTLIRTEEVAPRTRDK